MKSLVRNTAVFGGLGLIGVGLWLLSPWLSLTVLGGILFLAGVYSIQRSA